MCATWNTDNPAVSNQITADIADIEENLQELHDVITAITNGTLGTTSAADFLVDSITSPAMLTQRSRFELKDDDEIYIHAGAYHHMGTVNQIVYWNSKLTSDIGSPDASDWYYLYLDDTAIVSADTNLLTATEFVWSNTEPAWSDANHGWYNGDDRCIFAVFSDADSDILEFFHDGGDQVFFADKIESFTTTTMTGTFQDVTLDAPKFSTRIGVTFFSETADAGDVILWRTNGQTGSTGHEVIRGLGSADSSFNSLAVFSDDSQKIEVKRASTGGDKVSINTDSFYLPSGI